MNVSPAIIVTTKIEIISASLNLLQSCLFTNIDAKTGNFMAK